MIRIRQVLRLHRILTILTQNGLDKSLGSLGLFPSMRFLLHLNPWTWFRKKNLPAAVALRKSLEELGPIFIKFGQALSTRPDILPIEIAEELALLQDKVPPFSGILAQEIIESTLNQPIHEIFATFDHEALASASIAQVHAATLLNGQAVVIKVLRPNIRKIIDQDLSLMQTFAEIIERYWPLAKRFKPLDIVYEFAVHLIDELDLRREAANGSQLRRNFHHSHLLYVPEIYWDYSRENVMVMERISGIPVASITELQKHNINFKRLAERGVEIFFTQVFRDSFFHADMHPGNIFVSPKHPENPQYICVDFGIVGTLSDQDKRYLAENLLAFFNRDYRRVAELHVASGWVGANTRIQDFEAVIRTVCEPIINKPLKDISFAQLAIRLFQVARRFDMEVQPQLILLQKTLVAVEGLGRQLDPHLNLWNTAKPYLEQWVKSQISIQTLGKKLRNTLPFFIEQLPELPQLFYEVLSYTKKEKQLLIQPLIKTKNPNTTHHSGWLKGFSTGLFFTLATFGLSSYFAWMPSKTTAIIATVTGLFGVILLNLFISKRS